MHPRPARREYWAAAALYFALTLLLTYPLSLNAHRRLPADDPDGHLFMWTLAWDTHAFVNQPLSLFDANIFYPNRYTLALSENLIGSAVFAAPVLWLTGNPILAVNVVSLLSCVLCGLGAYVLGRRVGLSPAAATLTGVIFAFSPPRFFRFSQLHLTAVQWIPFCLASLHAYLDDGRRRDLWLAVAFFTVQTLTSGHGGVFAAVAIALMLAFRLALGEPLRAGQRLRDFGLVGAVLLLPVLLFAIPYRVNQVETGLRRALDVTGTPIESFFASPTPVDRYLQSLVTDRDINGAAIAWLFPGLLPILLASMALIGVRASRQPRSRPVGQQASAWRKAVVRHKHPAVALMTAGLVWSALAATPHVMRAGNGLAVQAYPDERVVWTGYLSVDRAGQYNLGVRSEESSRLSVENEVIVDHSAARPESPKTGSVVLSPGSHRILLEQMRADRPSVPDLVWTSERGEAVYRQVPSWALSQRPVTASTVTILKAVDGVRSAAGAAVAIAASWWLVAWLAGRRDEWVAWGAPYRLSPTAFYLLLTTVSVALAAGASGPWRFVYWWPGFNFIRGPSRFMVLGVLGVAVLAGVGFHRLTAGLAAARRHLAAIVTAALLVGEFSAVPFQGVPYQLDLPAADRWVATRPKPFAVAEVPVTWSERYHSNYMLHSMAHWQKTVHGFSGILPDLHEELYGQLRSFPSEDSIRHLTRLDVTYVIVHSSWFPVEERAQLEERLNAFGSQMRLEYADGDSRVYSLR